MFYTIASNKDTGYLTSIRSFGSLINMDNIVSFYSSRTFYGDSYFPYGLDRSGEFTYQQVTLLKNHGWAYQGLIEGSREPVTTEEEQFIAVCQGRREPESAHEKVWALYREKISAPPFNASTLSVKTEDLAQPDADDIDNDFE